MNLSNIFIGLKYKKHLFRLIIAMCKKNLFISFSNALIVIHQKSLYAISMKATKLMLRKVEFKKKHLFTAPLTD
jgi:hypothetical protein